MQFIINIDSTKTLNQLYVDIEKNIDNALSKAMLVAEAEAKKSFGQPNKPKVRTGRLRSSIKSGAQNKRGWVTSDVVYAPVHEYGARIKPVKGKYLKFSIAGQFKSVKEVVIPARPFLEPAVKENLQKIGKVLVDELVEALNK